VLICLLFAKDSAGGCQWWCDCHRCGENLGLYVDGRLSWRKQVSYVVSRTFSTLRLLYRFQRYTSRDLRIYLVRWLIVPILVHQFCLFSIFDWGWALETWAYFQCLYEVCVMCMVFVALIIFLRFEGRFWGVHCSNI
jgi:hypothetical protein